MALRSEGAAARLMAASALHASGRRPSIKGRLATFCASRAARLNYRLPDSAVPGKMWMAGPGAAHTAQGYGAATGSVRPLVDAAMESLRREGKLDRPFCCRITHSPSHWLGQLTARSCRLSSHNRRVVTAAMRRFAPRLTASDAEAFSTCGLAPLRPCADSPARGSSRRNATFEVVTS